MQRITLQLSILFMAVLVSLPAFAGGNLAPKIKANKTIGFLPLLVKFSCNVESDDEIFLWDFADNSTSLGHYATNLYSKPGIYKVKVVVRSGQQMAVDSINIEVLANDELVNNMAKQRLAQAE